jgi:hypothetical protein
MVLQYKASVFSLAVAGGHRRDSGRWRFIYEVHGAATKPPNSRQENGYIFYIIYIEYLLNTLYILYINIYKMYTINWLYLSWTYKQHTTAPRRCKISRATPWQETYLAQTHFRKTETTRSKKSYVASVRERTIPTEWPPLVGEVSANFCGYRVPRGQREGSLRPYLGFLDWASISHPHQNILNQSWLTEYNSGVRLPLPT